LFPQKAERRKKDSAQEDDAKMIPAPGTRIGTWRRNEGFVCRVVSGG
jgi:hypothetical protein